MTAIRTATLSDLPAIIAIYADAVANSTATYEVDPPDRAEMERRFLALVEAGFPYLVAEADGCVAGFAYAGPFRSRPAFRFNVEHSVYVAAESWGKGIGRALMVRLIAEAGGLGFRQMVAVIGDAHPQSPSVIFHEKLGFRHVGRFEGCGFKFGRWLDTIFMQLALGGGNRTPPDPASLPERMVRAGRKL